MSPHQEARARGELIILSSFVDCILKVTCRYWERGGRCLPALMLSVEIEYSAGEKTVGCGLFVDFIRVACH